MARLAWTVAVAALFLAAHSVMAQSIRTWCASRYAPDQGLVRACMERQAGATKYLKDVERHYGRDSAEARVMRECVQRSTGHAGTDYSAARTCTNLTLDRLAQDSRQPAMPKDTPPGIAALCKSARDISGCVTRQQRAAAQVYEYAQTRRVADHPQSEAAVIFGFCVDRWSSNGVTDFERAYQCIRTSK